MINSTDSDSREAWKVFISTGSEKSFSLIYHNHFDLLYYAGYKYSNNAQLIEDSIHNVFAYLLKNRKKLQLVTNVRGYLLKSFRRQLFLDLEKQKKFMFSDQLEAQFNYFYGTEQMNPENEELSELHMAIRMSIKSLTAKQQEIIYLRYDCELSYEEISNILDISVDSCYKSVYRSIKDMKLYIEQMNEKQKDLFY